LTPGIPDRYFLQGDVPMTKEEIRALSISKLRLKEDSIVWDIGAGSGSISVEAALISQNGTVYAVEKKTEGIRLISKNIERFGVKNVVLIAGKAPDVLFDLPSPDRVFVGGTEDEALRIFEVISDRLGKNGIVVVNSVTLDTTYIAHDYFHQSGYDVRTVCANVSVSKQVERKTMMISLNPVFIVTAQKEG